MGRVTLTLTLTLTWAEQRVWLIAEAGCAAVTLVGLGFG